MMMIRLERKKRMWNKRRRKKEKEKVFGDEYERIFYPIIHTQIYQQNIYVNYV